MTEGSPKPVGLTKDTGWQVGSRRTHPISLEPAWQIVTSDRGLGVWLGEVRNLDLEVGAKYELADGTTGEVRVFKPLSHLRITYFPPDWPRASTIQVRVIPASQKTQISFHQEHIPGPDEREQRKRHFHSAHDKMAVLIEAE